MITVLHYIGVLLAWIRGEVCALIHGIHYGSSSALDQIVYFSNHGSVHKFSLVVRRIIDVMMNQSLGTHGNKLRSGLGIET